MKRFIVGTLFFGILLASFSDVAQAQYRAAPAKNRSSSSEDNSFGESVDLKKFRKGNIEWDTQELIASGMTALHEEHTKILKELESIKKQMEELKAQLRKLEPKP